MMQQKSFGGQESMSMGESKHDPWEMARTIVQDWLSSHAVTASELAHRAGLNRSILSRFLRAETVLETGNALKLYGELRRGLEFIQRRAFLDATGLLPLAAMLGQDAFLLTTDPAADLPPVTTYNAALWLVSAGCDSEVLGAWEQAYGLLRSAEQMLVETANHVPHTPSRIQAAQAGCRAAQQLLNLGDYNRVEQDLVRIQDTYEVILDPETKAELYRLWGWLDFYRGNYTQAERWFYDRLMLVEELGLAGQGHYSYHFLARIHTHQAQLTPIASQRNSLLRRADLEFDESYRAIVAGGLPDTTIAIDTFRRSQLLDVQRNFQEAKLARTQARHMLGKQRFPLIDLVEAKVALEDGETRQAKILAQTALEVFLPSKYAKGISDGLQILAYSSYQEGEPIQALEWLAAAICVYPYDEYITIQRAWEWVATINIDIIRMQGLQEHRKLVARLGTMAREHTGAFGYLHYTTADRSKDIDKILERLAGEGLD